MASPPTLEDLSNLINQLIQNQKSFQTSFSANINDLRSRIPPPEFPPPFTPFLHQQPTYTNSFTHQPQINNSPALSHHHRHPYCYPDSHFQPKLFPIINHNSFNHQHTNKISTTPIVGDAEKQKGIVVETLKDLNPLKLVPNLPIQSNPDPDSVSEVVGEHVIAEDFNDVAPSQLELDLPTTLSTETDARSREDVVAVKDQVTRDVPPSISPPWCDSDDARSKGGFSFMNDSSAVEIGEEFNEFLDFQETLVTKQLNEEGTKILPILNPTITTTIVNENVLVDSKPNEKLKMQTTAKKVVRESLRIQSIVVIPMHSFPAKHCLIPPSQPPIPLYRFTDTNFDPGGDKHRFRYMAVNSGNFHYKPSLLQIPWDRGKSIVYDFVISFKLFNWFTPVRSNTPPVTIFDSGGDMSGTSAISGGSLCIFSLLWLPWDRGKDDWNRSFLFPAMDLFPAGGIGFD